MAYSLHRKTLASLLIATSIAGGLTGANAADSPSPQILKTQVADFTASKGSIGWGIKDSFNSYIGGPQRLDGATYENGIYNFPTTEVSRTDQRVELKASGTVQFISHCPEGAQPEDCALNLTLSNPRIVLEPQGESAIYMTVRTKNYTSGKWEGPHEIRMATIKADGATQTHKDGTTTWEKLATNITAEGNHAFSNFYNTGDALAQLSFSYEGDPISTEKQDFTIGDSFNTGKAYNDIHKTFEVSGKLVHVTTGAWGSDPATAYVLDPATMQVLSTTSLTTSKNLPLAYNQHTGELAYYNTETSSVQKLSINAQNQLVEAGTLPFSLPQEKAFPVALGYNPHSQQYALLTLNPEAGQYGNISYFTNQAAGQSYQLPDPVTISPTLQAARAAGTDFDASAYYGDTYKKDGRVLEPLADGSFLFAPANNVSEALLYDQLIHLQPNGQVSEVAGSPTPERPSSLRGIKVGSNGYIYRWNTFWKSRAKIQVLKYEAGSFEVVRETDLAPEGASEISGIFFDGSHTVIADSTGGRLLWLDDTYTKVRELGISNMRKTNTENPVLTQLSNGDLIVPTIIENTQTYVEELWLTRLVKTQPVAPTEEVTPPAPTFSDVPADHPFHKEITWLAAAGITTGWEDGTFRPADNIQRAAAAAFFYRHAGSPVFEVPLNPTFKDVPASHPFYKEIEWMAAQGITTGWEDGTFRPAEPIQRAATAAFFYRYSKQEVQAQPTTPTFKDVPASHPFYKEIEWMAAQGITTGWEDGTFRPADNIQRAAAAAFFYRYSN